LGLHGRGSKLESKGVLLTRLRVDTRDLERTRQREEDRGEVPE
jgi:hypothetical protein